jgi:hypothetical protein
MNIISTWEHIAEALDKSVKTAKIYASLEIDPLPVRREEISGRVWITISELCDWAAARSIPVQICGFREIGKGHDSEQKVEAGKENQ